MKNTRGFLVSRLAVTFDPNAWVSLPLNLGRIFGTLLRPEFCETVENIV